MLFLAKVCLKSEHATKVQKRNDHFLRNVDSRLPNYKDEPQGNRTQKLTMKINTCLLLVFVCYRGDLNQRADGLPSIFQTVFKYRSCLALRK